MFALDFLISLYNLFLSLTSAIIDLSIIFFIFASFKRLNLLLGFKEYPVTCAPKYFRSKVNQLPLNPV